MLGFYKRGAADLLFRMRLGHEAQLRESENGR